MAVGDVDALGVVRALCDAVDAQDWATYGSHLASDATYEFVSQTTVIGRENIVEHERTSRLPDLAMTRAWFTADATGRVWWRYDARWTDVATGATRQTSGASTAVVVDGEVAAITSWIDLSFLLLAEPPG